MNKLRFIHLSSVEELRSFAAAWDDLWWRSDMAMPLARAELLAQWVEQFKPQAGFHALVVADGGKWIAALPLVSGRVAWMIPAGEMPCNDWAPCGDLLCDPSADVAAALDMLLAAVSDLPWPVLWLNEAMPETPRWQAFFQACERAKIASCYHERYRVGRVEIDKTWDEFQKQLPKEHRRKMKRVASQLESQGTLQLEMLSKPDVHGVKPWLNEAFDIENLSWKGRAGTSVLHSPDMFRFFVRQAEQLARWGQWEAASLRLDGKMLAFVHGFRAKGVSFAHKISFDPRYSAFSPGQLLFFRILERYHADGETRALDFMGPLNQSHSRWRPATYGVGRMVMVPRRLLGRAAIFAYRRWWRNLRDLEAAAVSRLHDRGTSPADEGSCREPVGAMG
jgi:CelD/BcsL family acetyltransferase involved in cellulose biosynthesis